MGVKHTPTPWLAYDIPHQRGITRMIGGKRADGGYRAVARVEAGGGEDARKDGNRDLIIRAVNSHAQLIAALEKARHLIEIGYRDLSPEADADWLSADARRVHDTIRAALSAAQAQEDGK